jgi:hypothetical protein
MSASAAAAAAAAASPTPPADVDRFVRTRILLGPAQGASTTAAAAANSAPADAAAAPALPAACLYVTGGGAQALAWLLATPGASRLVVDAAVPYSREATADLLLLGSGGGGGASSTRPPAADDAAAAAAAATTANIASVTATTAARLAEAAYRRAARLTPPGRPCVGLGATSALASEPPKRGAHRAHVAAAWGGGATATATLELAKGARTRWQEDGVMGRLVLRVLARAVREASGGGGAAAAAAAPLDDDDADLDLGLISAAAAPAEGAAHDVLTERLVPRRFEDAAAAAAAAATATDDPSIALERRAALAALLEGRARCVEFGADGRVRSVDAPRGGGVPGASPPVVYLSGSFNPLHDGHEGLLLAARRAAEAALAGAARAAGADAPPSAPPGLFELSLGNADKGLLPLDEAERRAAQFARRGLPLLATAGCPLFTQKAALLPGAWFAVGYDTAARLVQARYYVVDEDGGSGADDGGMVQMAVQFERLRAAGGKFLVAGRAEGGAAAAAAAAGAGGRFLTLADVAMPSFLADLFVEIPEAAFRNDVSSTKLRARGQGVV